MTFLMQIDDYVFEGHRYAQGDALKIQVLTNGMPYCSLTLNVPELGLPDNRIVIDQYVPQDLFNLLVSVGIISEPITYIQQGFLSLPVVVWRGGAPPKVTTSILTFLTFLLIADGYHIGVTEATTGMDVFATNNANESIIYSERADRIALHMEDPDGNIATVLYGTAPVDFGLKNIGSLVWR